MGLTATIQGAVKAAFDGLDDLVSDVTLIRVASESYDPELGYNTIVDKRYVFRGVFDEVKGSAFESTIVDMDSKVCYLLPNDSNENPEVGDKIIGADDLEFVIKDISYNRPNDVSFAWQLLVSL